MALARALAGIALAIAAAAAGAAPQGDPQAGVAIYSRCVAYLEQANTSPECKN